jgi:hypothetical protein
MLLVFAGFASGAFTPSAGARPAASGQTALVTAVRVRYAPSSDRLAATSTLTAADGNGPLGFGDVATSGQTIAAESFDSRNSLLETGAYVFGEPAGGWSTGASGAQLTASDGDRLGSLATSGNAVVVGDASVGDAGPVTAYVFSEPAGGWTGALHESASLIASGPGSGLRGSPSVAVSGATVFSSDGSSVYAFTEPPGGWSGTVDQSATLSASGGAPLDAIAVSGDTLVASSQDAVYVFTEPAGGWAGLVHQSAALVPKPDLFGGLGGPVAISGSTVAAAAGGVGDGSREGVHVFRKRAGGWSGTHHQAATLTYTYGAGELGPWIAVSRGTVVLTTANPGLVTEHECPCGGQVYAVSEPPSRWPGRTQISPVGSSVITVAGGPNIAIDGQAVVVGADDGVRVLTASPSRSTVTHVALARLGTAAPRLGFKLSAGKSAPGIKTFNLTLPRGLRFSRAHDQLAAGISTSGAGKSSVAVHGSELLVTLKDPAEKVSITIDAGAMTETSALTKKLDSVAGFERSAKHRPTRAVQLTLPIRISDGVGDHSTASIELSVT